MTWCNRCQRFYYPTDSPHAHRTLEEGLNTRDYERVLLTARGMNKLSEGGMRSIEKQRISLRVCARPCAHPWCDDRRLQIVAGWLPAVTIMSILRIET